MGGIRSLSIGRFIVSGSPAADCQPFRCVCPPVHCRFRQHFGANISQKFVKAKDRDDN